MSKYRIDWKSVSKWVGTERTEEEGDELFDTREEAEAALVEFEQDGDYRRLAHGFAAGLRKWATGIHAI